ALRPRLRFIIFTARRPVPPLGHELIELGLVLRVTQPLKEVEKFALLLLKPLQRLGAILVEGAIAARRAMPAGALAASPLPALPVPPAAHAAMPTTHSHASAPDQIAKNSEADRPEDD